MNPIEEIDPQKYRERAVTANQMGELDRIAVDEFGIDILQMMELAGFHLASLCSQYLKGKSKVLIIVGGGHNGGGGLVTAKHLYNRVFSISILLSSTKLKPATQHQLNILKNLKVRILTKHPDFSEFDLLIDAILGYSIKGLVKEPIRSLIENINKVGVQIISLDLPSGLNPDTGKPMGVSIRADTTLTLAAPKIGLLKRAAQKYVGNLFLADIGIPLEVFKSL